METLEKGEVTGRFPPGPPDFSEVVQGTPEVFRDEQRRQSPGIHRCRMEARGRVEVRRGRVGEGWGMGDTWRASGGRCGRYVDGE